MWRSMRTRKAVVIIVCSLVVGIVICGSAISRHVVDAAPGTPSHSHSASSTSLATTNTATFSVTSIDMSVSPTNVSLWKCGSYIQVVYNAVFHVISGSNGGTIVFSYTLNNGRSQTPEKLTILPGQHLSNFVFTWQGSLPSDHCAGYLGHLFTKSESRASTIALISHLAFMKSCTG